MIKKILLLLLSLNVCMAIQAADDDRVVFQPHEARAEVLYRMDHKHSDGASAEAGDQFDESHIIAGILGLHITYEAKAYIDRSSNNRFLMRRSDAHYKVSSSDMAFLHLSDENSVVIQEDGSVLVDLSDAMLQKIRKVNQRLYPAVRLCKTISEHDAKILWRAQEQCKLLTGNEHQEQHGVVQYEQQQAKDESIFVALWNSLRG